MLRPPPTRLAARSRIATASTSVPLWSKSERRAAEERTEASRLVAQGDRLPDRAQDAPVSGETATDVVAQIEAQALAYEAGASRGGEDGKSPDELRDLATDARTGAAPPGRGDLNIRVQTVERSDRGSRRRHQQLRQLRAAQSLRGEPE